ncbi:PH domain-containing protein [Streptomyces sp. NBC_01808]|uniref:PH domain-containing protein n=1 Tax=Streptomyces sp. NBC_01808 TaxID=2975947 RepID=UPI002DD93171|nr:PH domain-containing protein [Streptomyces sp. NBC_01808]WSA42187.1 PH domain-containing protein [Streptomyces sp. NBC_01808]
MSAAELPVTFRPHRTRVVLVGAGLVIFATLTAIGLTLSLNVGERISFVVVGLLFLGGLLLLGRPKVVADDAGVTVTNLTHRRHLAWAEILRVNLGPGDPWVSLDLADGTSLPVMGIQPGIAREQAEQDARALAGMAAERGTAGA